ncbi:hypothetical protein [Ilumatobacter sp.]|uniref:hypothetical protein n=1 Tax=Ilumatobacter sp. TaxID=1967498 RepID=UPI0037505212
MAAEEDQINIAIGAYCVNRDLTDGQIGSVTIHAWAQIATDVEFYMKRNKKTKNLAEEPQLF